MIRNGTVVDVETYCKDRKRPTDKENLRYILEVGNECPMCGKIITDFSADKHKLMRSLIYFPIARLKRKCLYCQTWKCLGKILKVLRTK